jgi:hypothetical protein
MFNYKYTMAGVNTEVLRREISLSPIKVAIDYVDYSFSKKEASIFFKANLTTDDKLLLDGLVSSHDYTRSDSDITQISGKQTSEGVPIVYSTPKPKDHYSCFTGAGDSATEIGAGERILFYVPETVGERSKDLTFNEDVYIKDGYITTVGAPFGASIDVIFINPLDGEILPFCINVPICGDYPSALDTEDRGFIPAGVILRIIVRNSTGVADEEPPCNFRVAGRLELYRKMR